MAELKTNNRRQDILRIINTSGYSSKKKQTGQFNMWRNKQCGQVRVINYTKNVLYKEVPSSRWIQQQKWKNEYIQINLTI